MSSASLCRGPGAGILATDANESMGVARMFSGGGNFFKKILKNSQKFFTKYS